MQIFLTKNETFSITPSVKITFDGKKLRIYVNDAVINYISAQIGDSFYVKSKGIGRNPKIKKIETPTSRGHKISYFLFGNTKCASSKDEFEKMVQEEIGFLSFLYPYPRVLISRDSYCFLLSEKKKNRLVPIISYVSDTISTTDLHQLLDDTNEFKTLSCPKDFLLIL